MLLSPRNNMWLSEYSMFLYSLSALLQIFLSFVYLRYRGCNFRKVVRFIFFYIYSSCYKKICILNRYHIVIVDEPNSSILATIFYIGLYEYIFNITAGNQFAGLILYILAAICYPLIVYFFLI